MPRAAGSARTAGHDRTAHTAQGRQHRESLRRLPHACDRAHGRERQRSQSHLQVHLAGHDQAAGCAEPLHDVPHRSHTGLGHRRAQTLADNVTVESG